MHYAHRFDGAVRQDMRRLKRTTSQIVTVAAPRTREARHDLLLKTHSRGDTNWQVERQITKSGAFATCEGVACEV